MNLAALNAAFSVVTAALCIYACWQWRRHAKRFYALLTALGRFVRDWNAVPPAMSEDARTELLRIMEEASK